jgi:outer membrane scaffolding protein for murein synthesis (MipA/OmpV family)
MRRISTRTPEKFAQAVIDMKPAVAMNSGDPVTWPYQWADDALVVSKLAYADVTFGPGMRQTSKKGEVYYNWNLEVPANYPVPSSQIAKEQLIKGGFHLASLLQTIWPYAMSRSLGGAVALAVTLPAFAPQAPVQPLWEVGVFGGAVSTPAYPASEDRSSRLLALPFLLYRGEVLRSDTSGIGARLLHTEQVEFDVGFAASLPAHSDNVEARRGMPDLGFLGEFGPRVKVFLANPTPTSRLRLELPLRAVMEVRGGVRRQGTTFEPRLVYEAREKGGPWSYGANVGVVFGDGRINRYFYEVAPQFATASRPAYHAHAGLMLMRVGLSASYKLNPDVSLFGFVRGESYAGAANHNSPLYRQNTGASIGAGFAWTLGRSSEPARGAP